MGRERRVQSPHEHISGGPVHFHSYGLLHRRRVYVTGCGGKEGAGVRGGDGGTLPVIIPLVFSFSQEPGTRLCPPPASYPQAAGRLSSHRLQLPPAYKLTRPGERKHSCSIPHTHTHTHTPVDRQDGAGVRQHAGGTRGDHTVKWIGPFFSASLFTPGAAVQAL